MKPVLYYFTVLPELKYTLSLLMKAQELEQFRLVGGTALSLQCGHRMSDDIDLFTDAQYGSVDFDAIDKFIHENFEYVLLTSKDHIGFGSMYRVGRDKESSVKVDIFYNEPFICPILHIEGIRLASIEEIIAMKLEILSQRARRKDFWDIHELTNQFSLEEMLTLHEKRYPYSHNRKEIIRGFTDFSRAEPELNPVCLRGKHWELIKLDMKEFAS